MKNNKLLFCAGIVTGAIAIPFAATAGNVTAVTDIVGDWDDTASWTGGVVPVSTDVALIRGGTQVLDVDAGTGSVTIERVTLAQSGSTATINVQSGGSLTVAVNANSASGQFRLGGGGSGNSTATLNVESGGTFSAVDFRTANSNQATDVSIFNLNGGSFSATSVNFTGSASTFFNVNGGGGSLAVSGTANLGDTTTLAFALDGTGASSITALSADTLTIGTASILSIDLGSYIYSGAGTDTITLASATTAFATGFDVGNIVFTNAGGLVASIDQTLGAGGTIELSVVPEPGTYALLAGLSGLTFVMLRRRK